MSFYGLPNPWDPGYVIPDYVMAEPPERGTFTTQWLPRGTIPTLVPDFLAKPGKRLLGRDDAELGSLGDDTLGAGAVKSAPTSTPAAMAAAAAAKEAAAKAAANSGATKRVAVVAGIGVVAYLLFRKKKR